MKRLIAALALGLLASAPARAKVRIAIDLDSQRLTATRDDGTSVTWKISSGRPGYETPAGQYSVMRTDRDHFSDEYDQAPMPYAMFFSPRGLAIHGSYERGLGRPRSHGCVRLSVANAQKLFGWVEKEGATVDIYGDTPGGGIALDDDERPRRGRSHGRSPIEVDQVYRGY
jgi:lipoprotein-anchoring transpeptidase ErfK/SrfK